MTTVTVDLDPAIAGELEKLASTRRTSASELAAVAIADFVSLEKATAARQKALRRLADDTEELIAKHGL